MTKQDKTETSQDTQPAKPGAAVSEREARLAEALRTNLRRRKSAAKKSTTQDRLP